MTIKIGSRLGPYEILSAMGAGGMGEVWRARDTRLERDVAVKVLPASFADNAQLRIRFLREAKSISSLNHPNICTLHDVGQEDGVDYLVMELIEGESLAEKLTRGPLPLDQVLRVGSQIATALHAAHRQGIIHRDLKPGNIMLTRSGAKLLDFGLAKNPSSTSGVIVGATGLATEARPLTEEGTILGTFQYMAPEQLEGLEAGPRTDIFALGCVLFEMATGKRAFEGKSRTSLIAAIVSGQPPAISSLVTMSPPALDHVVSRCLAKDPEERWQSAHDVASELQWIGQTGSASATAAHPVPHRRKRERLAWSVAATALLAIVAATAVMLRGPKAAPEVLRASITPSAGMAFDFGWERGSSLVLSPDGRHMLFSTVSSEPNPALWIRSLATGESKKIAGSEGGSSPFWSVDSRFVAFFAGGKLLKADLTGAPPTAVCDAPVGRGGSWNRDGTIIFSPTATSEIFRVSASGGTPQPVTKVNTTAGETTHRWPSFLPDGRHFLFLAARHQSAGTASAGAIWLGSLDSPERKSIVPASANAVYTSGQLLYVRGGTLLAQPFDSDKLTLTGDPVPVAGPIFEDPDYFRAVFSASESGLLAYRAGGGERRRSLTIHDRTGAVLQRLDEAGLYGKYSLVSFSPDAKRLVIEVSEEKSRNDDLWIVESERGIRTRLTFHSGGDYVPTWSPDGSRIAFSRAEPGKHWYLMVKDVDGMTEEKVVFAPKDQTAWASAWSADGRLLACTVQDSGVKRDVVIVPLDGSPPRRFLTAPYNEMNPTFSPDGNWITYSSDESGRKELYVVSWPDGKGKRQVSTGGEPSLGFWHGDEITYLSADREVTAVRVRVNGSSLDVEKPRALFQVKDAVAFGMSPDASRFAAVFPFEEKGARQADAVELVLNWPAMISNTASRK